MFETVSTTLCDTHVTVERTEHFRQSSGLTVLIPVVTAAEQLLLVVARFVAEERWPRSPEEPGRGGLGDEVAVDRSQTIADTTAQNFEDSSFFLFVCFLSLCSERLLKFELVGI